MTTAPMVLALALSLAVADDPRASNPHYREAQAAFADDRWEDAVAALGRAYEADARPEYLFMQAQVLRTHDRCDDAVPLYRRFIASAPPREDVLAAQAALELCGVAPTNDAPPPEATATPPEPDPIPPPAPAPRRRADPTTHALVWPGIAVGGVGIALLVTGHVRADRAERAATEPDFVRRSQSARALAQAGIVLGSIGAALVVGGIVRAGVVRGRRRSASRVALDGSWGVRLRF
jgi:tetratricopeptide (TPR) repeat protein